MIFNIDAQVILGESIDLSPFVISYVRTHSMCNVSHTGEIKLSPNVLQFLDLNEIAINVYEKIRIKEYGDTVLTGVVGRVEIKRSPVTTVSVFISDTWKRARDYFIDDPEWETNYETLGDMFGTLCDLCGVDNIVDSPEVGAIVLPPGQKLGLMSVDGALQELVAYGTAVIYVDGSGTAHLRRGPKSSGLRFTTGQTQPTDADNPLVLTDGNVFSATHDLSDENARDVISVWGYAPITPMTPAGSDGRIVATRSVDLGLPVPKTAVYASSLIQDAATAERLADDMISQMGKLDDVLSVECQGNPDISVLKHATVNVNLESATITGTKKITTVVTTLGEAGYIMNVTFNEFCPRFAAWSLVQVPTIFYAGTTKYGVYKSIDSGATWFEYNNALPSGTKYVKDIATTSRDEVLAIINGQLWYVTSSGQTISNPEWVQRTLPSPINSAGDSPAVGHGAFIALSGNDSVFDVLTTNYNGSNKDVQKPRSWVYSSTDSSASAWDSTQLYDALVTSGYNVIGYDINSESGLPTVIATTSGMVYDFNQIIVVKGDVSRMGILYHIPGATQECVDPGDRGIFDYDILDARYTAETEFQTGKIEVDFRFYWTDPEMQYLVFYYHNSSAYDINPGPFVGDGPFGTTIELRDPVSPPWPFALYYHDATLRITKPEVTVEDGLEGPIATTFGMYAQSYIDPDNRYGIYNGEPRSCAEFLAENPDPDGVSRYFTTAGTILFEFT